MEYTTNMLDANYNANFVKMFQNIYIYKQNYINGDTTNMLNVKR